MYDPLKNLRYSKLTLGMFQDSLEQTKLENNKECEELAKLDLNKIIQHDFPTDRYFREQTDKNQLTIHHTVSGRGVEGDINWWLSNPSRIATAVIINWDGKIHQCFSSNYWAHHLGVKQEVFNKYGITNTNNLNLNKKSVAIEIDAWGGLVYHNKKWYPAKWDTNQRKHVANTNIQALSNDRVYEIPEGYRGFKAYEKYTNEQIEAVRQLLVFWGERFNIPLDYNEDMWNISKNALSGKSGIWSHTAYRTDKSDCYPDDRLIEMLKSLK